MCSRSELYAKNGWLYVVTMAAMFYILSLDQPGKKWVHNDTFTSFILKQSVHYAGKSVSVTHRPKLHIAEFVSLSVESISHGKVCNKKSKHAEILRHHSSSVVFCVDNTYKLLMNKTRERSAPVFTVAHCTTFRQQTKCAYLYNLLSNIFSSMPDVVRVFHMLKVFFCKHTKAILSIGVVHVTILQIIWSNDIHHKIFWFRKATSSAIANYGTSWVLSLISGGPLCHLKKSE